MLEVDEFLKLATKAGLTIPKESISVNQRRESSQKDQKVWQYGAECVTLL